VHAQALMALGFAVIPVPFGEKNPNRPNWQRERWTAADLPAQFPGARHNIGGLCGEPSQQQHAIDLDSDEANRLADTFLPATERVHGRASWPRSKWWYLPDAPMPTTKYQDPLRPDEQGVLVELLGQGRQAIMPGSRHPSGEHYAWAACGEPARVPAANLKKRVNALAAASLLTRYWPHQGTRHDAALALAGGLLRGGWNAAHVERFVTAVSAAASDEEAARRGRDAVSTAERQEQGGATTGWRTLAKLLDPKIVTRVQDWLGMTRAPTGTAAAKVPTEHEIEVERIGLIAYLAKTIAGEAYFAVDVGRRLHVYRDGVYGPEGEAYVRRAVKALLAAWEMLAAWHVQLGREVVEYLTVDASLLWEQPPLDTINVQNGLLDWATGTLRPHSPTYLSPVQIPVRYDPRAQCPGWEQFVAETFPGDAQTVAWEIAGDLLTADRSIQKAVLLLGDGGNGKSTFLAGLKAFVGRANTVAFALHKLEHERFTTGHLVGKLANICPDLPSAHLEGTSTFKAVTGGDPIPGEFKYHDAFMFVPHCRLVFSANHPPQSADASDAFFRRWLVLPFTRIFEGAAALPRAVLDARLADPDELAGVLNHALAGLRRVRARGAFTETATMREAREAFREATDPVSVWLDRTIVEDFDGALPCGDVVRAYNDAARESGHPPVNDRAFGQALARRYPQVKRQQRTLTRGEGRTWCYAGLAWRGGPIDRSPGGAPIAPITPNNPIHRARVGPAEGKGSYEAPGKWGLEENGVNGAIGAPLDPVFSTPGTLGLTLGTPPRDSPDEPPDDAPRRVVSGIQPDASADALPRLPDAQGQSWVQPPLPPDKEAANAARRREPLRGHQPDDYAAMHPCAAPACSKLVPPGWGHCASHAPPGEEAP
jgi:P4 family phage/plasmid primase-like protien